MGLSKSKRYNNKTIQTVAFALKYMFKNNLLSKTLVQNFSFVDIVLRSCNVSTPLFSFRSLLLQMVKSRVSLLVLSVFVKVKIVFSVFMWRNHIPKLNITFPSQVLVSSDRRPYRNLNWRFTMFQLDRVQQQQQQHFIHSCTA